MAQDVPHEVLGEIFMFCLPESHPSNSQPNLSVPPLLLCHVCQSWRRAALGTPRLWHELTITLEFASLRSRLCRGFLRKKVETLEFWNSCRGGLLPSLHFVREQRHVFVPDEDLIKFVPFRTLFETSAFSNAEALTLSGFSQQDFATMSRFLKDMVISNLQFLSITQPVGHEENTKNLQFPVCPALRRLYLDSDADISSRPSSIVTALSWRTLTHFSAKLGLRRSDWYAILGQCVNLSFGCFNLMIWMNQESVPDARQAVYHPNLKVLSIRGRCEDLRLAVDGFIFPSLTVLRLSFEGTLASLHVVHRVLSITPALQELHLQTCNPLTFYDLRRQCNEPALIGSLSKFVPHLLTLVIDPWSDKNFEDLSTLLNSSWLNDGWSHLSTQKSMFILYDCEDREFYTSIVAKINPSVSLNFRVSGYSAQGRRWDWQQITAVDLRYRWDDLCGLSY